MRFYVVQEMKKLIRRSALVGVLLIVAIGVFAFLQFRGTIPSFADTSDASYEKLCGFEPSHGRVWTTSSGFGSGGAFYRLNLARSAYSESRATIRTESNRPPLPHAPWSWGAKPGPRDGTGRIATPGRRAAAGSNSYLSNRRCHSGVTRSRVKILSMPAGRVYFTEVPLSTGFTPLTGTSSQSPGCRVSEVCMVKVPL